MPRNDYDNTGNMSENMSVSSIYNNATHNICYCVEMSVNTTIVPYTVNSFDRLTKWLDDKNDDHILILYQFFLSVIHLV